MRKEYFIFLVFVISAAIVSGYTLAFASCFKVIANHNPDTRALIAAYQAKDKNTQISYKNTAGIDEDISNPTPHGNSISRAEMMVVSSEEKEQLVIMLTALGMQEGQDYNQFIKNFQQQQSLNPTGNLDSATLNKIVQQVKLKRTKFRLES